MHWTKDNIIVRIKQLHRQHKDLAYNAMCRLEQSLVSAAAYHYGSYKQAVEQAGVDYADVLRRPRWSKELIVQTIKAAKKKGEDLNWSAVTSRKDELGKAAFASLQPRLFGRWEAALEAAGLDAGDVARYRKWDEQGIVTSLRDRAKGNKPMNSGGLQADDPGLHAAAVRHFGSYDNALLAAKVDPNSVRRRRTWSKDEVVKSLKQLDKKGERLSDSVIRKNEPALYGAAVRLFGNFTNAREAAGIAFKRLAEDKSSKKIPAKPRK